MRARAKTALLCDDIRQESNGKHILVGVYTHDVRFKELPTVAQFDLLVQIEVDASGEHTLECRFKRDSEILTRFRGDFLAEDLSGPLWLPLSIPAISIEAPFTLSSEYKDDDDAWTEFFEIQCLQG